MGSSDQHISFLSFSSLYLRGEVLVIVIMKRVGGPTAEETNNNKKEERVCVCFLGEESIYWSSRGPRKYVIY